MRSNATTSKPAGAKRKLPEGIDDIDFAPPVCTDVWAPSAKLQAEAEEELEEVKRPAVHVHIHKE